MTELTPSPEVKSAPWVLGMRQGAHPRMTAVILEATMTSLAHFENLAKSYQICRSRAVIDGKLVDSHTGKTFDNIGPRNGKLINKIALCDEVDVDRAVAAARKRVRGPALAQSPLSRQEAHPVQARGPDGARPRRDGAARKPR